MDLNIFTTEQLKTIKDLVDDKRKQEDKNSLKQISLLITEFLK